MKKWIAAAVVCWSLATGAMPVNARQEVQSGLDAIVRISAKIPENARTADILGTEREGSGVIIDTAGHILTIGYLILEADRVEITTSDARTSPAALVGYDHRTGFGLVKAVRPLRLQPVEMGRSSDLEEGAPVLAAGYGGKDAVKGAQVVSRRVFAGYWEYLLESAIFTTPPIGNFGGAALIGSDGRLVGIGSLYTQLTVQGLGSIPCNMFVPIDLLKPILEDLKTIGRARGPSRPWLGLRAEETHGRVIVTGTTSAGPAETAGIEKSDVILKVKGDPVKGLADFFRKVWGVGDAGVEVPLDVLQETEIREITIVSGDRRRYYRFDRKGSVVAMGADNRAICCFGNGTE